jgi:hypothetical protein
MPINVPSPFLAATYPFALGPSPCALLGCRRADHGVSADAIRENPHAMQYTMLQSYLQPPPSSIPPLNQSAILGFIKTRQDLDQFFQEIVAESRRPPSDYVTEIYRQMVAASVLQPTYYRTTLAQVATARPNVYGKAVMPLMMGALSQFKIRSDQTNFAHELHATLWRSQLNHLMFESSQWYSKPDTDGAFWNLVARVCELVNVQQHSRIRGELQTALTHNLLSVGGPLANVILVARYNWKEQELDVIQEAMNLNHLLSLK